MEIALFFALIAALGLAGGSTAFSLPFPSMAGVTYAAAGIPSKPDGVAAGWAR